MAKVVKPFSSATQRFQVGAEVSEGDDISPHSFPDFVARGFISDAAPAKDAGWTATISGHDEA